MFNSANSGYKGYSMSVRAATAYANGEKPLSKWTKDDILSSVKNFHKEAEAEPSFSYDKLSKLTLMELKQYLLQYSSYHHTSAKFNTTNFYSLNGAYVGNLTDDKIDEIISNREKRKKSEEVKEKPTYITSYVEYDNWVGQGKWKRKQTAEDIVQYRSTDKLVSVYGGEKRLSSLRVLTSEESKKGYPSKQAVLDKYLKTHKDSNYNRYLEYGNLRVEKVKKTKTGKDSK